MEPRQLVHFLGKVEQRIAEDKDYMARQRQILNLLAKECRDTNEAERLMRAFEAVHQQHEFLRAQLLTELSTFRCWTF